VITRRTARRLMEGYVCVPAAIWPAEVNAVGTTRASVR